MQKYNKENVESWLTKKLSKPVILDDYKWLDFDKAANQDRFTKPNYVVKFSDSLLLYIVAYGDNFRQLKVVTEDLVEYKHFYLKELTSYYHGKYTESYIVDNGNLVINNIIRCHRKLHNLSWQNSKLEHLLDGTPLEVIPKGNYRDIILDTRTGKKYVDLCSIYTGGYRDHSLLGRLPMASKQAPYYKQYIEI